MAHDLLVEPLLSWRDPSRRRGKTTLPGALALLANGELADFPHLRTHQQHPWNMFLIQLAAIALRRAGSADPRLPEDEWRQLLLNLTDGTHEPWSLVVADLSQPAFFQCPVPEGALSGWSSTEAPDDIDVLVTAKGHDVKTTLIPPTDREAWVYALTTLQTTQGYPGRGYNRVARMNGGYGNRPRVGLATDHSLGARFLRDLTVLLSSWSVLVERGFSDGGIALVWAEPWDGRTSLAMDALAPHFIEVCWRLRCVSDGVALRCHYTTTTSRRCLPEVENGDVGDPWVPIEREKGALTVGAAGFHYQLLTRILLGADFAPAPAQAVLDSDRETVFFHAAAMARGQGKTEGLHDRSIPIPPAARRCLGGVETRAALGQRALDRVVLAKKARSEVLFPALKRLALGGAVRADEYDDRVDEIFFDHLFATLEQRDEEARLSWERRLAELAWMELQSAIESCAAPEARRYRAIADAERMFRGCLRKHFADLVSEQQDSEGARA
jgi:CRISPR system Cascade subunit CasA